MTASAEAGDGVLVTFRESPFAVKALLSGVFVNKLGAFVQVFLVLFMTSRGFRDTQAGFALGAYGGGSVVGVLIGGAFNDRVGPRRTIIMGMLGSAAMLLLVLYVHVYLALVGCVVVLGLLGQIYRPAAAALLASHMPQRRQVMAFAMYRLALNLGTTAAPLLGAALASVSYDLLFWGEAVAAIGYTAIALFALPPDRPSAERAHQESGAKGYRSVLRDARYFAYLVAMLINAAVYVQYLSTLPLAMKAAGLETLWYGAVVALNSLIVICFELLMTKVTQRLPMRLVLGIGFTLLGGGMAFYALPGGLAVFVTGTLLWSLAEIVEGPAMFAYPAKVGPEQTRGRYIGAAYAMFGVGSALGPVAGVFLWVHVGSAAWGIIGATSVLALIPGWLGTWRSRPLLVDRVFVVLPE